MLFPAYIYVVKMCWILRWFYFSRNNTIVYSGETNTGRNPIIELSYADGGVKVPIGFSRCIFDIDLTELQEKYNQKNFEIAFQAWRGLSEKYHKLCLK